MTDALLRLRFLAAACAAAACLVILLFSPALRAAEEAHAEAETGEHAAEGVDWQSWTAGNELTNTASLQRGAANFTNYCLGCHSLKYLRYERMAKDLAIPESQLAASLMPAGAKATDYMISSFPADDATAWFGKPPPDLSLIARSKGTDHIYRFLKGFIADSTKATGTDNLALEGASMPAVLSDLEGVKKAVFAEGPAGHDGRHVLRFEQVAPGRLTPVQFDGFVRDTTNFLAYAGEPARLQRQSMGIWVVLFLVVFTLLAWMLKREYWKDVH